MPDEPSHVEILADEQVPDRAPVTDVQRAPEPPEHIAGAQWDEVHQRWEQWDESTQRWVVVGDDGDGVDPAAENRFGDAAAIARSELLADELEAADEVVVDVPRAPEPPEHIPGAQWNEVAARWEQYDEASGTWVAVPAS